MRSKTVRTVVAMIAGAVMFAQAGARVGGQQGADGAITVPAALCWEATPRCAADSRYPLVVGWYELVSQRFVSQSASEVTYRATLISHGTSLPGATATLESPSAGVTIVDGSLSFGPVSAGGTVVSSDTITFLLQGRQAFPWARLQWRITPRTYVPGEGVLLPGDPTARALDALTRMPSSPAAPADIVHGVILTRLDVAITAQATVGQVNAALAAVGGGVVTMRPGLPVMTVAVPRQPDGAALQQLADRLKTYPGIRLVLLGRTARTTIRPEGPAAAPQYVEYLAAARFPAAWNVHELADCQRRVSVLVPDSFGANDSIREYFAQEVSGFQLNGDPYGDDRHGYDVLATMAASIDFTYPPTGANPFPDCLNLRGVSSGGLSMIQLVLAAEESLPPSGPVVVNLSMVFNDDCEGVDLDADGDVDVSCFEDGRGFAVMPAMDRAVAGLLTRNLMRPHQDRVLIAAAAGNSADDVGGSLYAGARAARFTSWYAIAATSDPLMTWVTDPELWQATPVCSPSLVCFPSLAATPDERAALDGLIADLGEVDGAPLQNVLIVGSTDNTDFHLPSVFSEPGADVFAVGEGIPTVDNDFTQGTSFAAPQVAGLASYLLMVQPWARNDPDAIANVTAAIRNTLAVVPAQFIDAFAATLALDPTGTPDPSTWQVRKKLLDVTEDGQFTEADIEAFIPRYFEPPDYDIGLQVSPRDFSRYDLNGDGNTGSTEAVDGMPAFDLDRTGSPQYGAPQLTTLTLDIFGARRELDERFVTDLDVLCYYAYSPLYEGITTFRDVLLDGKCVETSIEVSPSSLTLDTGGTFDFEARVTGAPDSDVVWSLPGGGGTIDPQTGFFTAGNVAGTFAVRATRGADADDFAEATVTIREDDAVPAGTYTGTIVQHFTWQPQGQAIQTIDIQWDVRMPTAGTAYPPSLVGTARYRSVYNEYVQPFSDVPPCLLSTATEEGTLMVTSYSGNYSGSNPDLVGRGGYFIADGNVTHTHVRNDCFGDPGTTISTRSRTVSTQRSVGNYLSNTLPVLTRDANGNVTALTWDFRYTNDNGVTDEVRGQVTQAR